MSSNEPRFTWVDFDQNIEDTGRILFLVKNLSAKLDLISCDQFDQTECHHGAVHCQTDKCSFCKLFDLIREKNSQMQLSSDALKSIPLIQSTNSLNSQKYYHFNIRYSKHVTHSIIWSQFNVFYTPYVLIAYASCSTHAEVNKAIEAYENEKKKLKGFIVTSRLILDFHLKHEMSDEFRKTLRILDRNASVVSLSLLRQESVKDNLASMNNLKSSTIDFSESVDISDDVELDDKTSLKLNSDLGDVEFSLANVSTEESNETVSLAKQKRLAYQQSAAIDPSNGDSLDEAQINAKVKSLGKEVVLLDFLFARDGIDKIQAIVESEKTRLDDCIRECLTQVVKNMADQLRSLDVESDTQVNHYSEILKTPLEIASKLATKSVNTTSSLISIKVVSKKIVVARMFKRKADLYMLLNSTSLAVYNYTQAYSLAKKEEDLFWQIGALQGLCASSCLYYIEKNKARNSMIYSSIDENDVSSYAAPQSKSQLTLKDLRSNLKKTFSSTTSSKDVSQQVVSIDELDKSFLRVVDFYHEASDQTKFMCLELSLAVIRFFLSQRNKKVQAFQFINKAIYITKLEIDEPAKIRRYTEIASIYQKFGMSRLAAFYQWISVGRLFVIRDRLKRSSQNRSVWDEPSVKCLIDRSIDKIISLFDELKIFEQKSPSVLLQVDQFENFNIGFPIAKKYLVAQLVELLNTRSNSVDTRKFVKFLFHEMRDHLSKTDWDFCLKTLNNSQEPDPEVTGSVKGFSDTKFFKIPCLESFHIDNFQLEFNRMTKIKVNNMLNKDNIYIHRHENISLMKKKKIIYNLPVNKSNRVKLTFSNPIPIELKIERIDLIVELPNSDKFIKLNLLIDEKDNTRSFVIPALSKESKMVASFRYDQICTLKIIGYEIELFNSTHKIYFYDIYNPDWDRSVSQHHQAAIQSHYQIEMIPKLPVIKDIHLSSPLEASRITRSNYVIVNTRLGTVENFELEFVLEDNDLDKMEIIETKFSLMNEQLAHKLNTKITFNKQADKEYILVVDSVDYNPNEEPNSNESDVNSLLEIKYTNESGKENNLCNVLKVQVVIKFSPVYQVSLADVTDLSGDLFRVSLLIKNFLIAEQFSMINSTTGQQVVVDSEKSETMAIDLKKFTINELYSIKSQVDANNNSNLNFLSSVQVLLNKAIGLELDLDKVKFKVALKLGQLTCAQLSNLLKCPIELNARLGESSNMGDNSIQSLIVLYDEPKQADASSLVKMLLAEFNIVFKIRSRSKIGFISTGDQAEWKLEGSCFKELYLLVKESQRSVSEFTIEIGIENRRGDCPSDQCVPRWRFLYNLASNCFTFVTC